MSHYLFPSRGDMPNSRPNVVMFRRIIFTSLAFTFLTVLCFITLTVNGTLNIWFSRSGSTSEKDLHLSLMLLCNLYDTEHVYAVHFDCPCNQSAVDSIVKAIELGNFPNIHIIPHETLTYSGISLVLNTLSAMTVLLKYPAGTSNQKEWDFFINLSGSDYPLLTPCDQAKVLGEALSMIHNSTINFLQMFEHHDSDYRRSLLYLDPALTMNSLVSENCKEREALKPVQVHPFQHNFNFTLYKAEAWMILSRETVKYLTCESFPRWMLASFVNTVSSPEHYFVTVLKSSSIWKNTIYPFAFRYVRWIHPKLPRVSTQHPFELDLHEDLFWDDIYESGCWFARKFSQQDSLLQSRIDSEIAGLNSTLLKDLFQSVTLEKSFSIELLSKKKQFLEDRSLRKYFCSSPTSLSYHLNRSLETMRALITRHFSVII
ncbi:Beta-glucuronosyltransferase GlcAT14B [Galdieria sulphuraria]|nr:Beta-glucuronosyltransferase GlcAT14B [Galdieria sulphuraria]